MINSPFRYAGGKFRARSRICKLIPDHSYYAEPFAGGASIFFAKDKALENVLNDKDKDLINCYFHIRDHVEDLIAELRGEQATRERYDYYKNEYPIDTRLQRAVRWYYLNRTSFSGIMKPQNCYWGYRSECSMPPENWPTHLKRCSEKLQGVKLTANDFEQTIQQAPDGAFLFIDPPYFGSGQTRFYAHIFTEDDHHRLASLLEEHRNRIRFLLTYNDCDPVRDLYSWADTNHLLEQEWQYTLARTDDQRVAGNVHRNGDPRRDATDKGKRVAGKELFILNYTIPSTVASSGIFTQGVRDVHSKYCAEE